MTFAPISMRQIDAVVLADAMRFLSEDALADAVQGISFAIDPQHLGPDPHLRCEVDRCGLSVARLQEIDSVLWTEIARRSESGELEIQPDFILDQAA